MSPQKARDAILAVTVFMATAIVTAYAVRVLA